MKYGDNVNCTFDDTVVKYTVNIPIELYAQITAACRDNKGRFVKHRSEYIREVLAHYCTKVKPVTMSKLYEVEQSRRGIDQPQKYHGFVDSLMKSVFYSRWWKKKSIDRLYQ
jgi:hypothetical protein